VGVAVAVGAIVGVADGDTVSSAKAKTGEINSHMPLLSETSKKLKIFELSALPIKRFAELTPPCTTAPPKLCPKPVVPETNPHSAY
jgi:hypothetical protein